MLARLHLSCHGWQALQMDVVDLNNHHAAPPSSVQPVGSFGARTSDGLTFRVFTVLPPGKADALCTLCFASADHAPSYFLGAGPIRFIYTVNGQPYSDPGLPTTRTTDVVSLFYRTNLYPNAASLVMNNAKSPPAKATSSATNTSSPREPLMPRFQRRVGVADTKGAGRRNKARRSGRSRSKRGNKSARKQPSALPLHGMYSRSSCCRFAAWVLMCALAVPPQCCTPWRSSQLPSRPAWHGYITRLRASRCTLQQLGHGLPRPHTCSPTRFKPVPSLLPSERRHRSQHRNLARQRLIPTGILIGPSLPASLRYCGHPAGCDELSAPGLNPVSCLLCGGSRCQSLE